jgi:hypothetical protein
MMNSLICCCSQLFELCHITDSDFCNRSVAVMRLLSEGTIEEGIHQVAQEKLNLEREISNPEGKCILS